MSDKKKNPLIEAAKLRHSQIPFDTLQSAHFMPAIEWSIDIARTRIEDIKAQKNPDFKNVIEASETSDYELEFIYAVFSNFSSVMSDDEIKNLETPIAQKLTQYGNDISLDKDLFKQVQAVYEQKDKPGLEPDQMKLLEDSYKGFVRSGALLDDVRKKRLREINERSSELSVIFSQNVLNSKEAFEYWVDDIADLKGMPQDNVDAAKDAAAEKGVENKYLITLDVPQVMAVLDYADNRELRKAIWSGYSKRAQEAPYDNQPIVIEMVRLKQERAALLGYENHAHFTLEERMAKNTENVMRMLEDMKSAALPAAHEDYKELCDFAKKQGFKDELKAWDVSYFVEKLQKEKYGFDEQAFKPYFQFENVLKGAFSVAERMYDISFNENDKISTYHPDVKAYDVIDNKTGEKLAVLVSDYFVRKGKRGGAWMNVYRPQSKDDKGNRILPIVGMHGNFQKPSKTTPSLLTYNDVETLFHEFGHALHGMLSDVRYASQAGPMVKWDFVELPSQVMENWVSEKEVLDTFAEHYKEVDKNGQPKKIPQKLIEQKNKAKNFRSGSMTLGQVRYGILDMAWYTTPSDKIKDVRSFEEKVTKPLNVMPPSGAIMSPSFSHIFGGGYAAGYYSYKWAEILDADAFEAFKEKGLFDKETTEKFKTLLKSGSSIDPEILYRDFRGRDADPAALLRRSGLNPANSQQLSG